MPPAVLTQLCRYVRGTLLALAYRLLYVEAVWAYDLASWLVSAGAWWRWQARALRYAAGGPALEIGCGPGHLLARLRRLGGSRAVPLPAAAWPDTRARSGRFPALAVELSAPMARRAASRNGPGAVVRGDARRLPIASASVRTVVLTFPAPFVLEPATLAEIRRVLRPGGRCVVVEGALPPRGLAGRLATGLLLLTSGSGGSESRLAAACRAAGFRVRQVRERGGFGTVWLTIAERTH